MQLSLTTWLLSFLPVLTILFLMLILGWGGSKAGLAGWAVCIFITIIFFGLTLQVFVYTQLKALLLAADVLYIVWTALLLYNVANEAGTISTLGQALSALSKNQTTQGLIVGWLFASFLQGLSGFGVPVAVSAPLLVSIGFSPVQAVVMSCVGHGWAVNFGSLATAFQTLIAVTGLSGESLAPYSALLLGIACLSCGMLVAFAAGGWQGLKQNFIFIMLLGSVMATTQYFLTTHQLWTLGATAASLSGLVIGILFNFKNFLKFIQQHHATKQNSTSPSLRMALLAYLLLIILAVLVQFFKPLKDILGIIQISFPFPELRTSMGWVTPAEQSRNIPLLSHTGALLFYTSCTAFWLYYKAGYYQQGALKRILNNVWASAAITSVGITAMVGMSVIMSHTGMTYVLAQGLSQSFSRMTYPFIAPLLGALGAFITGSNNNSNILFAILQQRTAEMLNLPVYLILGAQTAGGALGSIIAPAKVMVGCSTVGLTNQENLVMNKIVIYGMIPVIVVAISTVLIVFMFY